jgi:TPR repeat protein
MKTSFIKLPLFGKVARMFLLFAILLVTSHLKAQFRGLRGLNLNGFNNANFQKPKKAVPNDTAAVLNFNNKPADQFVASKVQDISGVWEGEQSNGTLISYYKVALVHLNDSTYSGYDYCAWVKYIDHTPINPTNGVMPKSKKSFLGTLSNAELSYAEIQSLDNTNWGLTTEKFKIVDDNGTPAIINDNNQPDRKFYLKRTSNAISVEDLKYFINDKSVEIVNPIFKNSDNESVVKYNDHGLLSLAFKNATDIDLNNVDGRITTTESDNGILRYNYLSGTFNIPKNNETPLPMGINTDFYVPSGTLHFNIKFTYKNIVIAQKTIEVPTKSFFKTTTFKAPEYTSSRMKAVGSYYGFSSTPYEAVSTTLEPLVASGDKMASMWKAVLLSTGRGQYKLDPSDAYTIAKTDLNAIEEKAKNGDAEALYLLFYACQMGLEGETAKTLSYDFLAKSAAAGFRPAVYDEALNESKQKGYSTAFQSFQKLYDDGMKKAAIMIGTMYEQGYGMNKDVNTAIQWYKKGIAFGDPEAMFSLANVYTNGFEDTPPDVAKAMSLATQSAAKNCTDAMEFLGRKYFDGQGVAKNIPLAFKWFKDGANLGDRKSMLALGETYLSGGVGVVKDEKSGLFWIKKAAELGSPKAMMVLWAIYTKGEIVNANVIVARYWYNQAVINGYATPDATGANAQAQTFLDFVDNADFRPSYVYVNEYGNQVGDSGDGLLNGMLGGLMGSCFGYYGHQQQLIDGLEYICKKDGNKIYGGTLSSAIASNLYLKQGQTINIKCYGTISTGMFSGMANADGLGGSWQEYTFVKGIPCSAVMARVKDGTWQFIGQQNSFTASKDGPLYFALNGIDYRNYKGYFDIVVQVPEDAALKPITNSFNSENPAGKLLQPPTPNLSSVDVSKGIPDSYVRLENFWKHSYLNIEKGTLDCSNIETVWWSAEWQFIHQTGSNTYKIKCKWKDIYLSTENPNSLYSTNGNSNSALWTTELIGNDKIRIKNVANNTYLNIETGKPQYSNIGPEAWSSQWILHTVSN